jgi:hypothetical protein
MKTVLSLLTALSVCTAALFAQPQQSANFRITKSVLDGGGGSSASANFKLVSAYGQPTPLGAQTSTNFALSAGFLSPVFAVSPISPIQHLVIQFINPNILMNWERVAAAQSYVVFRDTTASFTPGPSNQIGVASDTFFVDVNAISLPKPKYFYSVKSSSAANLVHVGQPEHPAAESIESDPHSEPLQKRVDGSAGLITKAVRPK